MAVQTWQDPVGGLATGMIKSTIAGPAATTVYTDSIPLVLPDSHLTVVASASSTLTSANSFDLYGTYDGTNYVKLVDDIVAASTLAAPLAGTVDLEQYPALRYKIAETSADDESAKEITFYLIFRKANA